MTEPRKSVPPYLRVSGIVEQQIRDGKYLPGEAIPSMAKLSELHEISRGTARRVQMHLRDLGLVEITPGWGAFVTDPSTWPK